MWFCAFLSDFSEERRGKYEKNIFIMYLDFDIRKLLVCLL